MTSKEIIEQEIKAIKATRDYLASKGKDVTQLNEALKKYDQVLKELIAFEILKNHNLHAGKSKYSATGYFVVVDTDVEEQEYNAINNALIAKEMAKK